MDEGKEKMRKNVAFTYTPSLQIGTATHSEIDHRYVLWCLVYAVLRAIHMLGSTVPNEIHSSPFIMI